MEEEVNVQKVERKVEKPAEFVLSESDYEQLTQMTNTFAAAERLSALDYRSAYRSVLTFLNSHLEKR